MLFKNFNAGFGLRQVAWIVVRPLVGGPVLAVSLIALGFAIHARLKVTSPWKYGYLVTISYYEGRFVLI